jgi:hypothetical protein
LKPAREFRHSPHPLDSPQIVVIAVRVMMLVSVAVIVNMSWR